MSSVSQSGSCGVHGITKLWLVVLQNLHGIGELRKSTCLIVGEVDFLDHFPEW